jgi:hypothetical protein
MAGKLAIVVVLEPRIAHSVVVLTAADAGFGPYQPSYMKVLNTRVKISIILIFDFQLILPIPFTL